MAGPGVVTRPQSPRFAAVAYVVDLQRMAVTLTVDDGRMRIGDDSPEGLDLADLRLVGDDARQYHFRIRIKPDNRVSLEVPRMEIGRGIAPAAVVVVAEELDVEVESIDSSLSPTGIRHADIAGFDPIASLWCPLRQTAAALRKRVVLAAAGSLSVPVDQVTTGHGRAHVSDGRSARYFDLFDQYFDLVDQVA